MDSIQKYVGYALPQTSCHVLVLVRTDIGISRSFEICNVKLVQSTDHSYVRISGESLCALPEHCTHVHPDLRCRDSYRYVCSVDPYKSALIRTRGRFPFPAHYGFDRCHVEGTVPVPFHCEVSIPAVACHDEDFKRQILLPIITYSGTCTAVLDLCLCGGCNA